MTSARCVRGSHRARLEEFDLILAMDQGHMGVLRRMCPANMSRKVGCSCRDAMCRTLLRRPRGLEQVLDLVEAGCRELPAGIKLA